MTLAAARSEPSPSHRRRQPGRPRGNQAAWWSSDFIAAIRSASGKRRHLTWKRIAAALKRDPYGRTARQIEKVLEGTRPSGIAKALWEVLEVRPRPPGSQRTRRGGPPRAAAPCTGSVWGKRSSRPGSG